ncbi:endonuclease III domain-containing protein [Brachybacterium sp. GCM10030267]|uniref:endonuclease III domain-containing protein n=1 Tax=Brachybacterium sp. GCM10030267 TaxID=3273381 RepID=UPI0036103562
MSRAPAAASPGALLPLAEADLRALQRDLLEAHGPLGAWWPGEEPFEIAVGAVLVQRSRWEQAAASIANLRGAGLLEPGRLAAADEDRIRDLVRGSGFASTKPGRLLALARWTLERGPTASELSDGDLRTELLAVEGIGEETADAIALYCFSRPAFICDEYARRLLTLRGHAVPGSYRAFRRRLAPALDRARFSVPELAELHGLIVEEGKASPARRGVQAGASA